MFLGLISLVFNPEFWCVLNIVNWKGSEMSEQIKIVPCLDIQDGRVVKGVHFVELRDAGDPVSCAKAYCQAGADELILLDSTDAEEGRSKMVEVVRDIVEISTVPITVGGGIVDIASAGALLEAGASKVSTTGTGFRRPEFIEEMIREFGPEKVIVTLGVEANPAFPSGYEVYIDQGMTATGKDVVEWAKQVDSYGVPIILPTSKAGDGMLTGYELPAIRAIKQAVSAKVVAAGGAGRLEHFYDAIQAGASILLAASVFHFDLIGIRELKDYLRGRGVNVAD